MPIGGNAGGDMSSGGTWLRVEDAGSYHMLITGATDTVTKKDGTIMNGALFQVTGSVLAGTQANRENKCTDFTFWDPAQKDDDAKRARSQKEIDKFLVAVGVLTPEQAAAKASYLFEPEHLKGRQFIVELQPDRDNKYLVSFDNFHHVDDPRVKNIPKKQEMLASIPPQLRLTAAQQKSLLDVSVVPAPGLVASAAPPAAAAPSSSPVDPGAL